MWLDQLDSLHHLINEEEGIALLIQQKCPAAYVTANRRIILNIIFIYVYYTIKSGAQREFRDEIIANVRK